ncbi:MAG: methyltransferase [Clostridiaceae bacterium]|nr:methyltransferase [Clostridiales bacterium]NLB43860.1 methyltransferase [Clostridiaceae bacterium]
MCARKRVLDALNHRQPDRVPLDIGATMCSGMHVSCVAALRDFYGLEKRPVKVHEPFQMLGLIEEDLEEAIGVDIEGVNGRNTLFGFPCADWKPWRLDSGLEVLVPGRFNTTRDEKGNTYLYPEGDTGVPPSGKMPKGGFYFDAIIRQEAFDEDRLDPEDNLEEFTLITDEDLDHFKTAIRRAAGTGRAVLASFGGMGLGDVALVPGPFLKHPKGIRDVAEWYISTAIRQDYIHQVFARQTDIALENLRVLNEAVGKDVAVAFICGTDFGTQTSTFCSPETFQALYVPYYKKINGWIHAHTSWKTFKHCCGAIEPFLKLFIEAGFDVINPVQCSAAGMEPEHLKNTYGDHLTFWGGGVDTQHVLPFGTPRQVREQVLARCDIFSRNGGFVFAAIHNIQAGTPVANIAAMIEAVHAFNGTR